jgi:glycosidase
MKYFLPTLLFIFGIQILNAQLVTTSVPFPVVDEPVTVYFDASLGSAGLAGYNGDVYAHTGVITSESTSGSDWKYVKTGWGENSPETKLTRIGSNLYQIMISPNIKDYYNVPEGEEILQMAFVFRSGAQVGGSWLEGKTAGGGDIFIDVYTSFPGLVMNVINPQSNDLLVESGSSIPFEIQTSLTSDIRILEDGIFLQEVLQATELDYDHIAAQNGEHILTIEAITADTSVYDTIYYSVIKDAPIAGLPINSKPGITYLDSNSIRLVLEAPGKQHVIVKGDFSNWRYNSDYTLNRNPEGTFFWIELDGLEFDEYYSFQYLVDQEIAIADPYSEVVLDPWNDPWITEDLFPNLPPYPAKTLGIVSLFKTGGFNYEWTDTTYTPPPKENLVIYELLLRDFLEDHSYLSLIDTLDYLEELGINAIELMPINEFEGNNSWGYNPSFHMAVDKYYGHPDHLKAFVEACHARGIAVIQDVVYNHAFSLSPFARLYWDDNLFRPTSDNPWLNEEAKHPFNVGYDFNHESQLTKNFVKQTLKHWIENYHIDGFRFDLSKGFTQNFNTDVGKWGEYDLSRIRILKEYADHIWSIDNDSYVILEHFADNDEEIELSDHGMMLWGSQTHSNFKEATLGYHGNNKSDFYWTYWENRGWNEPNMIPYMESHDEERLMYDIRNNGNSQGDYDIKEFQTGINRIKATSAFFYMFPGPKMLWQFGELAYDYSINTCEDGSVNPDCRLSRKPVRWDYLDQAVRFRLREVTKDLIHLKNYYLEDAELVYQLQNASSSWKSIGVENSEGFALVVAGNFDLLPLFDEELTFPSNGRWYDYFTGDSIEVTQLKFPVTLEPGRFKLYTNERVSLQSGNYSGTERLFTTEETNLKVFPNLINRGETINLISEDLMHSISIMDINGRTVFHESLGSVQESAVQLDLSPQTYLLLVRLEDVIAVKRLVVQ